MPFLFAVVRTCLSFSEDHLAKYTLLLQRDANTPYSLWHSSKMLPLGHHAARHVLAVARVALDLQSPAASLIHAQMQ